MNYNILRFYTIMDDGMRRFLAFIGFTHFLLVLFGITIIIQNNDAININITTTILSVSVNCFTILWSLFPSCGIFRNLSFARNIAVSFSIGFFFNLLILIVLFNEPECSNNAYLILSAVIFWSESIVCCIIFGNEPYYTEDVIQINRERRRLLEESRFCKIPLHQDEMSQSKI
jgi:hypothetical protein